MSDLFIFIFIIVFSIGLAVGYHIRGRDNKR